MTENTEKPQGRVLTGPGQNIFKSESGGRQNFGGLIMSALTGLAPAEIAKRAHAQLEGKVDARKLERITKEIADGGDVSATLLDAEDEFFLDYLRISGGPSLLAPPITPERLERLVAENNALEPCIAAMVTNISCTGFKLVPKAGSEADLSDEEKEKRKAIRAFLDECAPRKSFTRVRKELRRDLHTTGNSYMVVERNLDGDIAFLRRAPSKSMRMIKLDDPTPVEITMMRNGEEVKINTVRAERRYVQKIGTKLVYYKEYGASRDLNRYTGGWSEKGSLTADQRAHEIVHDQDLPDVRSPYGVPRWITQLPSVLGSRMAEEHNLAFFQAGGVPPVIVFITGGLVSADVAKSLNDYLSGSSKDKQRGIAVEVPSSGVSGEEKPATVNVQKFGSADQDSTFEVYLENNEKRVRRAFRLPGIFLGMCHSADTEYLTENGWKRMADIQDGDRLAQVEDGTLTYATPLARHEYDYTGDLVEVRNRGLHYKVTPNHRMLVRPATVKVERPWRFMEAGAVQNMKGANAGQIDYPVAAVFDAERVPTFTLPECVRANALAAPTPKMAHYEREAWHTAKTVNAAREVDMDVFLELLGYIVSEGHVSKRRGAVTLSQNPGPVADAMWACMVQLGLNPGKYLDNRGTWNFHFCHTGLWEWLRETVKTYSLNARLPEFVFSLPKEQTDILLDALCDGDGHRPRRAAPGSFIYTTASERLADDVQRLCVQSGKTARKVKTGNYWRVSVQDKAVRQAHKDAGQPLPYSGKVGCFTMPAGTLVTRVEGNVLISGNSDNYNFATAHASFVLAEAQVFAPERDEEDERINMTLMPEIDPDGLFKFVSDPVIVQDVSIQLQALTLLSQTPGVSLSDWIDSLTDVANVEVTLAEAFEDRVFDGKGGSQDPEKLEEAADNAPPGLPPPQNGQQAPPPAEGPPTQDGPEAPTPGVTSPVRNAQVFAANMARAIKNFEEDQDPEELAKLAGMKDAYEAMSAFQREQIDKALTPYLYQTAFLPEAAAMIDVAGSYAMCAMVDAERRMKGSSH